MYVSVTSGPDRGKSAILPDVALGPGVAELHRGDKVVLGRTVDPTDGRVDYYFDDYQRRTPMLLLGALFAVLVVAVGRWRGLASLVGLVVTALVLVRFVIPSILENNSPVSVAIVGSAAIIFVVIYVAHGFNPKTTTALLGTLASLALTAGLAALFVAATHLTGLSSEETTSLQSTLGNVPIQGLILAGGFVRHPVNWAVRLAGQVSGAIPLRCVKLFCVIYARYARFRHKRAPETLASIGEFVANRTQESDRRAIVHRYAIIADNDLRSVARQFALPVYYLAGLVDPLVPWPFVRRSRRRPSA